MYAKIDPEVKKEWVKELRSGKYKQGMEYLKADYPGEEVKHCCLGVLCEVIGAELKSGLYSAYYGNDPVLQELNKYQYYVTDETGNASIFTAHPKLKAINLKTNVVNELANQNDGGASFEQIADWIEENL